MRTEDFSIFDVPVTPYGDAVRDCLRTSDLVLMWGRGLVSRAISGVHHDPSHAAILIVDRELDIVWVHESVEGQGARMVHLSRLIERKRTRYDGAIAVYRHTGASNPAADRAAARIATADSGEGYAYSTLGIAALRRAALAASPRLERRVSDLLDPERTTYICSEKAAEWYLLRGLPLDAYGRYVHVPEPVDLLHDRHFYRVARLL